MIKDISVRFMSKDELTGADIYEISILKYALKKMSELPGVSVSFAIAVFGENKKRNKTLDKRR